MWFESTTLRGGCKRSVEAAWSLAPEGVRRVSKSGFEPDDVGFDTSHSYHASSDTKVYRLPCKEEMTGSIPVTGSKGRLAGVWIGSRSVRRHRLASLGIKDVFLGVEHKIEVFEKYLEENNISREEVVYMGDDIPDYHVMKRAAVSACPADAAEEIRTISKYISHYDGGKGCVRDIIEQVLKLQSNWMDNDAFKW